MHSLSPLLPRIECWLGCVFYKMDSNFLSQLSNILLLLPTWEDRILLLAKGRKFLWWSFSTVMWICKLMKTPPTHTNFELVWICRVQKPTRVVRKSTSRPERERELGLCSTYVHMHVDMHACWLCRPLSLSPLSSSFLLRIEGYDEDEGSRGYFDLPISHAP